MGGPHVPVDREDVDRLTAQQEREGRSGRPLLPFSRAQPAQLQQHERGALVVEAVVAGKAVRIDLAALVVGAGRAAHPGNRSRVRTQRGGGCVSRNRRCR